MDFNGFYFFEGDFSQINADFWGVEAVALWLVKKLKNSSDFFVDR